MKTWMKVLMWLGLGGGIGFFAGYQIGARNERKSWGDVYGRALEDARELDRALNDKKDISECLEDYRGGDHDGDSVTLTGFTKVKEDIDKVFEDPEMPMEEPVIEEPEEIRELHPQDLIPQIITEEEYTENPWSYDKENLGFYDMDKVLYNYNTRSVIQDPDEVVGIGTLFGFYPTPLEQQGKEELFVRNDTLGMLFRIVRFEAAYYDQVSGAEAPEYEDGDDFDNGDLA